MLAKQRTAIDGPAPEAKEPITVTATLVSTSPVVVGDDVYPRILVLYLYDLKTNPTKAELPQRLQVLHWASLGGSEQTTITERVIGQDYHLQLAPATDHPELAGEQINITDEDLLLPRFYDVER